MREGRIFFIHSETHFLRAAETGIVMKEKSHLIARCRFIVTFACLIIRLTITIAKNKIVYLYLRFVLSESVYTENLSSNQQAQGEYDSSVLISLSLKLWQVLSDLAYNCSFSFSGIIIFQYELIINNKTLSRIHPCAIRLAKSCFAHKDRVTG